jgi:ubiquitin-like protein Pup
MTEREKKQSGSRRADDAEDVEEVSSGGQAEELTDRIDDILDEIDTVLEENAEEFVKNYVQKGGE